MNHSWPEYLKGESLFSNAIRLRNLIWTIQRYVPTGSRALEVGFGSGATAFLLADLGYDVTAVDIDRELVERGGERFGAVVPRGRLDIRQANMLALPWRGRQFDLAYHQGVLEHFPDEQIVQALREQARVARWVIFDVPNNRHRDPSFGDERLLPPAHWRRLVGAAGLQLVAERGRGFQRWLYLLPAAFFSHGGLERWPWFSRWLGTDSIFVCSSPQR